MEALKLLFLINSVSRCLSKTKIQQIFLKKCLFFPGNVSYLFFTACVSLLALYVTIWSILVVNIVWIVRNSRLVNKHRKYCIFFISFKKTKKFLKQWIAVNSNQAGTSYAYTNIFLGLTSTLQYNDIGANNTQRTNCFGEKIFSRYEINPELQWLKYANKGSWNLA